MYNSSYCLRGAAPRSRVVGELAETVTTGKQHDLKIDLIMLYKHYVDIML
jgi:hypothetical protein